MNLEIGYTQLMVWSLSKQFQGTHAQLIVTFSAVERSLVGHKILCLAWLQTPNTPDQTCLEDIVDEPKIG